MKKILTAIVFCIFFQMSFAQIIDISTGLGSAPLGSTDVNWKVSLTSPAVGPAYIIASFGSFWETTPVSITGARWINVVNGNNTPGPKDYVYERKIPVSSGIRTIKFDFKIAFDDALKSLEIVKPDMSTIVLNPISTTGYHLSKSIKDSFNCPIKGTWIIRAIVTCGDMGTGPSGLLVSGTANLIQGQCCDIPDQKCSPDFKAATFKVNSQCNVVGDFNPTITGGAEHYWGLLSATSIADGTPIPLATIIAGGSFGLHVSSTGTASPVGMGTGITASTSGYGFHYEGVSFGECFKVNHYIKCCNKWYSKTITYCTKICPEVRESKGTEEIYNLEQSAIPKRTLRSN